MREIAFRKEQSVENNSPCGYAVKLLEFTLNEKIELFLAT